ncbi:MAG: hypothetical protein L0177_18470 [Chloroflexi bacterium]|nr:hypothetical protein [Chloroflexota bacterium]
MSLRVVSLGIGAAALPFLALGFWAGGPSFWGDGVSVAEASSPDVCGYFTSPVLRRLYDCDSGGDDGLPHLAPPHEEAVFNQMPVICEYATRPALRRMYSCESYQSALAHQAIAGSFGIYSNADAASVFLKLLAYIER